MERFKKRFDRLYKLDEIREKEVTKVLHISDTPDIIYPFIFSVVDRLKPDYIIHTGDLADNIKLGSGAPLKAYKKSVGNFVSELNKRDWADKIYIIPGNHDNIDLLRDFSTDRINIYNEGSTLKIKGVNFGLAHYKEHLPDKGEIYLYGHDKTVFENRGGIYLNGLLDVNIILLPDRRVERLSYPLKTDGGRQYKRLKLP